MGRGPLFAESPMEGPYTFGKFPMGVTFLRKIHMFISDFFALLIKNGHMCVNIHIYVIGATSWLSTDGGALIFGRVGEPKSPPRPPLPLNNERSLWIPKS